MEKDAKEAMEAIRLHALWMSGRMDELTLDDRAKEITLWGGTNGVGRGERLLDYMNTINEELEQLQKTNDEHKCRISVLESGCDSLKVIIGECQERLFEICHKKLCDEIARMRG